MATIKVKFRPSSVSAKEGMVYYRVIHNREIKQICTGCKLFPTEWDNRSAEIRLPLFDEGRKKYLLVMKQKIEQDLGGLTKSIAVLEAKRLPYTSNDVINGYLASEEDTFFVFTRSVLYDLKCLGKTRISETYASTLNSFIRFREGQDISLNEVDSDLMLAYEAYLKVMNLCPNTTSFYMRNLRAVYNRAVEKGLTPQRFPFKHVYTGIGKTVKRAISLKEIRRIKELALPLNAMQDYSRDLFLFSFYTRGMSFVDMAFLKKKDLNNGILSYRRRKTGQQLLIRWEKCMQEIVDKYDVEGSPYLLPIIRKVGKDARKQYESASHIVNRKLKAIGSSLGLPVPLTMYVARHAWASIAQSKNVPLSVISEGMGHDSESTTRIYLASLDTVAVDRANNLILRSL